MENKQYVLCCFLILHYMDIELTYKAVDSVLNLQNFDDSKIVIVDNASPNGSGKLLEKKYKAMEQIHIILASENLGFSAGNNLGFQYIKNHFIVDFVIAMNNDILFPQHEFINRLKELYLESPFWVAGPDIILPHKNYHSSPASERWRDEQDTKELIEKAEWEKGKLIKKLSLYGFKLYIKDCFPDNVLVKNAIKLKHYIFGQDIKYYKRKEGIVLQGSCLIFDKRYCRNNENLFLPLTFLYAEEEILTWLCKKNNWEIRYFPEIYVWHTNHGSLQLPGLSYKQYCNKKIKELDRFQKSLQIYLEHITAINE